MTTRTGCAGEMTKLNALSAASPSAPTRTVPRVLLATVTGWNVTDAEPLASTSSRSLSIGRPPISSVICPPDIARVLRLTMAAVTATRSWLSNAVRANETAVTDTFG